MSELERHTVRDTDWNDSSLPVGDYYAASDVDALIQSHARELSERDRREGELRAECEEKTRRAWDMVRERTNSFEQYIDYHSGLERQLRAELLAAKGSAHETVDRLASAESELATLRQELERAVRALHDAGQKQLASTFYRHLPALEKESIPR